MICRVGWCILTIRDEVEDMHLIVSLRIDVGHMDRDRVRWPA